MKILFNAQLKTLDLSLSISCRDGFFKANLCALKRPMQADNANWRKETQNEKLTKTWATTLKNFKVDHAASQIQISKLF